MNEGDKKATCKGDEYWGAFFSAQLGCPRSEHHSCLKKPCKVGCSVNFLD